MKIQEFEFDSSLVIIVPAALKSAGEISCSVELNHHWSSARAEMVS